MSALTFRSFCESSQYLGLTLSPLVAAIADAADGVRPTTITDAESVEHFGCPLDELPTHRFRTIAVRAGARGGKTSRLGVPAMLFAAWTVPAPDLRRGEVASVPIIAPDLELARQALSYAKGYVEASPILSRALVEETKDSITLRRPLDGRLVRIEVRAAARGGRTGRGRTLLGALLDESAFFLDAESGVVCDTEVHRAVAPRIVPGGWEWLISTPWIADTGLLEGYVSKNFGMHGAALVATAGTRMLNPSWDPTGEIERDLVENDPENHAREILAQPMAGGSAQFFDGNAINAAIDETIAIPSPAKGPCAAGADFAFRRDSSAVVVSNLGADDLIRLVAIDERKPAKGSPLKPSTVVTGFAETIGPYHCDGIVADGHYSEAVREHLDAHHLKLEPAPEGNEGKAETYQLVRSLLHEGRIRLPRHPRLLAQLRAVQRRPLPGGGVAITSPRSVAGGHGDVASAFVLSVWKLHSAHLRVPDNVIEVGDYM